MSAGRAALCAGLALAAFLGTARALAAAVPLPERHDLRAKLGHLLEHGQRYDALVIGSSRVYRSVVPRVVARGLAEQGETLAPYNLGIPGAEPWEIDYYLQRVLAAREQPFRVVLIEVWPQTPEGLGDQAFTLRRLHWHDLARTRAAVRACLAQEPWTPRRRIAEASVHVSQYLWRLTSHGMGPELAVALGPGDEPPEDAWLERDAGYRALERDPWVRANERRREFLADTGVLARRAAELRAALSSGVAAEGLDLPLVATSVERVRASGALPVLLVGPCSEAAVPPELLAGLATAVLDYQAPDEHPSLFDPAAHFDANHLTREAAERFSRVLARDLAGVLAGGQ